MAHTLLAHAASFVSEAMLGDPSLGHQAAAEQLATNARSAAARARDEASKVVIQLHTLLEQEILDATPRALNKWRSAARRLRGAPPARTSTTLEHTDRLIGEIMTAKAKAPLRAKRSRDDFSLQTVRSLDRRAGHHCSNPDCRHPTAGPSDESATATMSVGEAAHITAAAPGRGARRYDASLTPEQRRSIHNGIWLCATCARMIDRDAVQYTVEVLRDWKRAAEDWARTRVQRPQLQPAPRMRRSVPYDPALHGRLKAEEVAELEQLAADLIATKNDILSETTRQEAARASLQVLVAFLTRHGMTAHIERLAEGTINCPRALRSLALPLLVLHVHHQVVVLDDAFNGLFCYFLSAGELDGEPLPDQAGWIKVDDPARAHLTVLPILNERLRAANMVAR